MLTEQGCIMYPTPLLTPQVTPEIASLLDTVRKASILPTIYREGRQKEVGGDSAFFLDISIYASSAAWLAFQSRNQSEESIPLGGVEART